MNNGDNTGDFVISGKARAALVDVAASYMEIIQIHFSGDHLPRSADALQVLPLLWQCKSAVRI